ncbi:hypothetical protein [Pseudomonas syringae pv. coryli]|uniref:hypothetical protein n=1 Tax=Pseudomonas syringae pv. coryli TaxID=317659 RepID=UPI003D2A48C1
MIARILLICTGPILGFAITQGIMNPNSIAAAGAFVGAGLYGVAIALCANSDTALSDVESPAVETET